MTKLPFEPEIIVLANGDYPTHPFALSLLQGTLPVVCCDGAANEFIARGGHPRSIIGDLDSVSTAYKEQYASKIIHITEQDTNDLTKSIHILNQEGFSKILILGATGKREDHTLGNISLLMDYLANNIECVMVTDAGLFLPSTGMQIFNTEIGQEFSVFNFGAKNIYAEGLDYPLRDFTKWWEGTLNTANSKTVKIEAEGNYLVYIPFE